MTSGGGDGLGGGGLGGGEGGGGVGGGGGLGLGGGGVGGGGGLGGGGLGGGGLGGGAWSVKTVTVSSCFPYSRLNVSLNPYVNGAHMSTLSLSPF